MSKIKDFFGRLRKHKEIDEPVLLAASAPVPSLAAEEANACHKILALRSSPAQIAGKAFGRMSPQEFKESMRLTMAAVHCGPGYRDELVDYVLSGQYEKDKER